MKKLETERLILKKFKKEFAEDVFYFTKNKNIGPSAGWKPHENIERTREIIDSFIEKDDVLAIYHKADKKIIGSLGIHPDEKRNLPFSKCAKLGYVLSEDYWGRGIMLEACKELMNYVFNDLDLAILSIYHFPSNLKSKRVIEKLNFKYEGILRKATLLYDDRVEDNVCYSITKDEYQELNQN